MKKDVRITPYLAEYYRFILNDLEKRIQQLRRDSDFGLDERRSQGGCSENRTHEPEDQSVSSKDVFNSSKKDIECLLDKIEEPVNQWDIVDFGNIVHLEYFGSDGNSTDEEILFQIEGVSVERNEMIPVKCINETLPIVKAIIGAKVGDLREYNGNQKVKIIHILPPGNYDGAREILKVSSARFI